MTPQLAARLPDRRCSKRSPVRRWKPYRGLCSSALRASSRRERALYQLPARHKPADLFRQPHEPFRRAGDLVAAAADIRILTRPVAARDYWERGRLRPYLAKHVFGAMLIDRQNIKVHQSPVDDVAEMGDRYSIIVFPEGIEIRGRRSTNSRAACITWLKSGRT